MDKNINLIVLEKATRYIREQMFNCHADIFGNVPCDNGRTCDNCNTDTFCKAVKNEYDKLIAKA